MAEEEAQGVGVSRTHRRMERRAAVLPVTATDAASYVTKCWFSSLTYVLIIGRRVTFLIKDIPQDGKPNVWSTLRINPPPDRKIIMFDSTRWPTFPKIGLKINVC